MEGRRRMPGGAGAGCGGLRWGPQGCIGPGMVTHGGRIAHTPVAPALEGRLGTQKDLEPVWDAGGRGRRGIFGGPGGGCRRDAMHRATFSTPLGTARPSGMRTTSAGSTFQTVSSCRQQNRMGPAGRAFGRVRLCGRRGLGGPGSRRPAPASGFVGCSQMRRPRHQARTCPSEPAAGRRCSLRHPGFGHPHRTTRNGARKHRRRPCRVGWPSPRDRGLGSQGWKSATAHAADKPGRDGDEVPAQAAIAHPGNAPGPIQRVRNSPRSWMALARPTRRVSTGPMRAGSLSL